MISAHFLLDTNVLSEPTKIEPNVQVIKRLAENIRLVATASVAYYEFKFGCLNMPESRRKQEIAYYIRNSVEDTLPIFPYCELAAKWHAEECSRLRKMGKTPPYMDGQIAAIAFVNNLTLVTRNVKDFQHFQDIKVENWFA